MNDEHKPTYQRNIITELQVMADYRFQRYCIDHPTGRWRWYHYEYYENIFEGQTLLETWEEGEWMFDKEIDTAIAALGPELQKVPYEISELVAIKLPQMQVIREKAAAILAMMGKPPIAPYALD